MLLRTGSKGWFSDPVSQSVEDVEQLVEKYELKRGDRVQVHER